MEKGIKFIHFAILMCAEQRQCCARSGAEGRGLRRGAGVKLQRPKSMR
jgi:hypothetical protein